MPTITRPSIHHAMNAIAIAALLASHGQTTMAQETTLPSVEVLEQAYSDSTLTIRSQDNDSIGARDTRDMLQHQPGVSVGGGGMALAQKLYVRNIEDTLLTVTLDGVPQGGNVFHHQGRILVNPDLLKRVEIDKGGTVASVGPGGLAGSVRMTTKDASDMLRQGQRAGGQIEAGWASFGGQRIGASAYGFLTNTVDMLVHAQKDSSDNYQDGNGKVQARSGAEQTSNMLKANWQLTPGNTMHLGYHNLKDKAVRFLRPHLVGYTAAQVPIPQALTQDTMTLGYSHSGQGWIRGADIDVFTDDTKNTRTNASSVFGKGIGYHYGEQLTAHGVNVLLRSAVIGHSMRYGLNQHMREAKAINPSKLGVASNTGQESSRVTGIFAESAWSLSERWQLDAGARHDWYSYTDNHAQRFSSNGFSPNAALTFMPADAWSIRMGSSRTVRGPGLKEAFMLDNGPGPYIYKNERNLKEEVATNHELSAQYQQGGLGLKASVFRMTIDNYLSLVFDSSASTPASRKNAGQVKSNGYELAVDWQAGAWRVGASVSNASPTWNGLDLGDGDFSLGTSAGRTWTGQLAYSIPQWHLDLSWHARWVEKLTYQPAGATSLQIKAGYNVHDIFANWQPLGREKLRVTLGVKNLFDKFYYDQSTYGYSASNGTFLGFPEPGRQIRVDMNWKF